MLNLAVFNADALYGEVVNKRLTAHVLYLNWQGAKVVDSFLDGDVVKEGFDRFKLRVDSYATYWDYTLLDSDAYRESEPGCNFAIFTVKFKDSRYQLNFVEIHQPPKILKC